ncbi:biopolymer transporter ExbD [Kangiella marina]|uniref:Biopolymer transporter ExbD n=1 Tax=Kangiella marina TaxID=1079178 RepID=A0ABP8IGF1_9GAMM
MKKTRRRLRNHLENSKVDMTSMLDIIFILLLFFIVTTSFITTDSLVIAQPTTHCAKDCKSKTQPLILTINGHNEISFNDRIIDIEAIQANLESQLIKDIKTPLIVRVHADAHNYTMVSAVDQANKAGISSVSVAPWR